MVKLDVHGKIILRLHAVRGLFRRIHDITDTIHGNTGTGHLGDYPSQRTHRPGEHGVVGDERDIVAGRHMAADYLYCTQDYHQHHLCAGNEITGGPEEGDEDGKLHIGLRIDVVLCAEFFPLHALPPESTDDPDSGEVFLGDGGEIAFFLVRHQKGLANLAEEHHGIEEDHRDEDGGQHRQLRVQAKYEVQGKDDQQDDAEHAGQLLRQKLLHRLHVRCAALDQVSCAVFPVPGETDPLQMGEERVSHPFHQCLGTHGV